MTELLPLVGLTVSLATVAAVFLLYGLSLTLLCRATGVGRVWMAWVPFANQYLLGLLADVYTDNRLTDDSDRADPFYTPSTLRRGVLGYGIAKAVAKLVGVLGLLLCLFGGAMAFFLILGTLVGGAPPTEVPPFMGGMVVIGALLSFIGGIFYLVLTILHLTALCPALCRVLTALDAPIPALWVALGVLLPLIPALLLLVCVCRADGLGPRFAPPPPSDGPTPCHTLGSNVRKGSYHESLHPRRPRPACRDLPLPPSRRDPTLDGSALHHP